MSSNSPPVNYTGRKNAMPELQMPFLKSAISGKKNNKSLQVFVSQINNNK